MTLETSQATGSLQLHEVYAVKYAQNNAGDRGHNFHGLAGDPHDENVQMDYFVWLIRSNLGDIVVDVGFTAPVAARRARGHLREPSDALRLLDVDCESVKQVVLTHLHYDHSGDLSGFPNARFYLQQEELAFWTGKYVSRPEFRKAIEQSDIIDLVNLNYEGRVELLLGDQAIADGVWLYKLGGHTPGLQVVRIRTARGDVVLASDAAHFYENLEGDKPYAVFSDLPDTYRAFDRVNQLASSSALIVAGHDPRVFERFEAVPGLEGIAVRVA